MRPVFVLLYDAPVSSLKLLRVQLLSALAICGLSGCTDKTARNSGDAPAASNSSASSQSAPSPTGKTASSAAAAATSTAAVDNEVRRPATVTEAAKVLDLSNFPMLEGAVDPGER